MQGLQVWNERIRLSVSPTGHMEIEARGRGRPVAGLDLQEGGIELSSSSPVTGLLFYALPCAFESLAVHREGSSAALINRAVGEWPAGVDDDELQTYPHLHFLEERKTGMPWRFERWYTLADSYLIFDSEQYFERECARQGGKDWERFIVQLRQVCDPLAWVAHPLPEAANLLR